MTETALINVFWCFYIKVRTYYPRLTQSLQFQKRIRVSGNEGVTTMGVTYIA